MNDLDIMADLYDFEVTHPSAYYYLHDALGSTMGLLTDYPEVEDWNEFYRYDAWGNITEGSVVENPFLWAGYYQDEETNDYYCMNRYYKPTLARWTQNDPFEYIDGLNLYEYVKSRPIMLSDPSGLLAQNSYEWLRDVEYELKERYTNNSCGWGCCDLAKLRVIWYATHLKRIEIAKDVFEKSNGKVSIEQLLTKTEELAAFFASASKKLNKSYSNIDEFVNAYETAGYALPGELNEWIKEYGEYPEKASQILGKINDYVGKVHTLGKIAESATLKNGELGNIFIVGGNVADLFTTYIPSSGVGSGLTAFAKYYSEAVKAVGVGLNKIVDSKGVGNIEHIRKCFGGNYVPMGYGGFGYRWAETIVKSRKGSNHAYLLKVIQECPNHFIFKK